VRSGKRLTKTEIGNETGGLPLATFTRTEAAIAEDLRRASCLEEINPLTPISRNVRLSTSKRVMKSVE
jgi:hypothetical protein